MYHLSIDQASVQAGVSLWLPGKDVPEATKSITVPKDDVYTKRIQAQVPKLDAWLRQTIGDAKVRMVLFEAVPMKAVLVTAGAFLTCINIECGITERNFVSPSTWKKWAQNRGATGPFTDIKGRKALLETGYGPMLPATDDEADSIMMYLAWKSKQK